MGMPWGLKGEWGVNDEEATQGDRMEGGEIEGHGVKGGEEGGTIEDLFSGNLDPGLII
jgi:hypothetical protein